MIMKELIKLISSKIRIEPRVIRHLGQDLITSPEVAVTELLKNAISKYAPLQKDVREDRQWIFQIII